MIENKRKFKRFNFPLGVKFRPTYGAIDYCMGTTINLSSEGIGLDAHDFRFILYENLEMIIEIPEKGITVSLFGDVLWKKQYGRRCLAGIKFRMEDKSGQEDAVRKILTCSNIAAINMNSKDAKDLMNEAAEESPVPERASPVGELLEIPNKLGFIKRYYENGTKCRVTFRLLREMAKNTQKVTIVGDFNNWDGSESSMKRLENGDFVITMVLDSKREYRFKYLVDGHRWENDWYADKFVANDYGSKDSVVIV